MTPEVIIMFDSQEAATYRTDIKGWVARNGVYCGDGHSGERAARYMGCTHVACAGCGAQTERSRLRCDICQAAADEQRYQSYPRKPWDGAGMIYSELLDRYFSDLEEAEYESTDDGLTLSELRLVHCRPNYVRPIESDYFSDELPSDDDDIPSEVEEALAQFNKAVHGIVLSYSPTKIAVDLGDKDSGEVTA